MERRSNKRTAPFSGTDSPVLTVAEAMPREDATNHAAPTEEQHRALIAAHVETLAQLSDVQLEYSRLLNAATRTQQEMQRLQREAARVHELEREVADLHELEREVADLHQKLEALWRNNVAQTDDARRYAASLESRLDRINRSLMQRVLRRITGNVA